MTLRRLAILGFGSATLGLSALLIFAGVIFLDLSARQQEMARLVAVEQDVDQLSVVSDEIMLTGTDKAELSAYGARAERVRDKIQSLNVDDNARQDAINAIKELTSAVEAARSAGVIVTPETSAGQDEASRDLSARDIGFIQAVADRGEALDGALSSLINKRREAIAAHVNQLIAAFVTAVLGFAGLGVIVITALLRRLAGPVRTLETTVDRVLNGDRSARAPVKGRDELAKLAATFNAMLNQQQQHEAELERQKEILAENEAMLAESQSIANIGSWIYFPTTGGIAWSRQIYRMLGFDPDHEEPDADAFYARVHPEDRAAVRAHEDHTLNGESGNGHEFRIIRPEGTVRHVRGISAPPAYADDGSQYLTGTLQDVTEQRALEKERQRLRERLGAILDSVTDGVVSLDSAWRFAYLNGEAEQLLGLSAADVEGLSLWETVPALRGSRIQTELNRAMTDRQTVEVEDQLASSECWLAFRAYPSEEGLTVLISDTTERHQMLHRLMDQEARLEASHQELAQTLETSQALINSLPAHVALLDSEGNILDVNRQWCDYGQAGGNQDPDFSLGRNYLHICERAVGGEDEGASEVAEGLRAILRGERSFFAREYPCHSPTEHQWFRVVANSLKDTEGDKAEAGSGAVVMHVDITERKRAEEALNRIAYEDSLTGAASRHGFIETAAQRIAETGWQPHARVVMLDILHQHDINETYGFAAGDELLRTVAQRLGQYTDDGAVVGRSGGDEFVVFVPAADERSADAACEAIMAAFQEGFPLAGSQLDRRASFGYTRLGDTHRDTERLMREAEMALYYAGAERSPDSWAVYSSELDELSRQRVQITDELRRALARDEFELHFQPKVDLADGALTGAEALLRWWHPERGLQSPGFFIPIAEQSELIGPLGDWVLNEACRRLRAWQDNGLELVRIAVNVSVVQFADGEFPQTVANALTTNGVAPSALTLEITESVFEQNATALKRQLAELHEMGVRLSLDDFGTGYSSLLYLQQYPFDEIKIDKGFVMSLPSEPYNARVVSSVIGIAEALGAGVVAEGVESQDIADALMGMGCHTGQGFYYSMPLAPEDFRWLLETRSPLPLGRLADQVAEQP